MIRPIGSGLGGSIPIPFFSLKIELFYFHANFKKRKATVATNQRNNSIEQVRSETAENKV